MQNNIRRILQILGIHIFLILALSNCFTETKDDSKETPVNNTSNNRKWTIMIYMDGDNDLEEFALEDLNELEKVAFQDKNIEIIVLIDRSDNYTQADGDWSGTRLYQITHDSDFSKINSTRLADVNFLDLSDTGDDDELDMGDSDTLTNFVDFTKSKYPAQNYALILWNHGDGWRNFTKQKNNKFNSSFIHKVICSDETDNSVLYMKDVKNALKNKGLTIIGFDACLMGMVEVAYELKDTADYIIFSEELEPGAGWDYTGFLNNFISTDQTPTDFGKAIINSFEQYYKEPVTLSLVDLSKINLVVSALDTFINNITTKSFDTLFKARYKTLSFDIGNHIDLYDFANKFQVEGADELKSAIKSAVLYHNGQISKTDDNNAYANAHGLAIYFPYTDDSDMYYESYTSSVIDFAGASSWKSFLTKYHSLSSSNYYYIKTFKNKGEVNNLENCEMSTDTYLELYDKDLGLITANDDIDFYNGDYFSKIKTPLVAGTYYICVLDLYGCTGSYSIVANTTDEGTSSGNPLSDAYESNDTSSSATLLPVGEIQDHFLGTNDLDWFKLVIE